LADSFAGTLLLLVRVRQKADCSSLLLGSAASSIGCVAGNQSRWSGIYNSPTSFSGYLSAPRFKEQSTLCMLPL